MLTRILTPSHLFDMTITVNIPTVTEESGTGGNKWTYPNTLAFLANVQPGVSSEAIERQRDTGRRNFDIYMGHISTSGPLINVTNEQWKLVKVTFTDRYGDGGTRTLQVIGPPQDPISNGCILHLVAEEIDL